MQDTAFEFNSSAEDLLEDPREQKWSAKFFVVLMVDDDEDDYLLVKCAFEAAPFEVDLRWVPGGKEAMEYLLHSGKYLSYDSSPRPDLILLDIRMPQQDGMETLKEIKGHPYLQKIPVVLLTSSENENHKSSGLKLGASSFIVKPYDLEEMIKILNSLHEHYFGIIRLPDKTTRPAHPCGGGTSSIRYLWSCSIM